MEIIAEIGSNWAIQSTPPLQKERGSYLIAKAKEAGATAIKFQLFRANTLYSQERAPELYLRAQGLELPVGFLEIFARQARQAQLKLWVSVFDPDLVEIAADFADVLKLASGDLTYQPLREKMAQVCAKRDKPMAISTGAATESEIGLALQNIFANGAPKLYLLNCVSVYPARMSEYNLSAGLAHREDVDALGLSDHTCSYVVALLALALGYTIFEKHFRLGEPDEVSLPDYPVSLTFKYFRAYVRILQIASKVLETRPKIATPSEASERLNARRDSDGLRPTEFDLLLSKGAVEGVKGLPDQSLEEYEDD